MCNAQPIRQRSFAPLLVSSVVLTLSLTAATPSEGADPFAAGGNQRTSVVDSTRLYWTSDDGAIRRMTIGSPGVEVLLSGQDPAWIKVDRCAGKMFWTDSQTKKVYQADTEALVAQPLYSNNDTPFSTAVDPVEQRIHFSTLDGLGVRAYGSFLHEGSYAVVDSDFIWSGLAVDVLEGKLYGLDIDCPTPQCHGRIWKATLSWNAFEVVLDLEVGSYPWDIAIDPFDRKMYWSESQSWVIRRANLDGSAGEVLTNVAAGPGADPYLALDLTAGKLYWSDLDATNRRIMVANLDLSNPQTVISDLPANVTGLAVEAALRDTNANGIDDGCEWRPPPAPLQEAEPVSKPRFISLRLDGGRQTALRVRLVSLHHVDPPYAGAPSIPFTAFEGQTRFVGPPTNYREAAGFELRYFASQLQCQPYYRDWSSISLLNVTGSAIVPSSLYEVESLAINCAGVESTCSTVSAPLTVMTSRWGDVILPFNPSSASGQPDITDVSAIVDKFRNAPGALTKPRVMLAGFSGDPYGEIGSFNLGVSLDFSHISACVDAFRGLGYPYSISSCP